MAIFNNVKSHIGSQTYIQRNQNNVNSSFSNHPPQHNEALQKLEKALVEQQSQIEAVLLAISELKQNPQSIQNNFPEKLKNLSGSVNTINELIGHAKSLLGLIF